MSQKKGNHKRTGELARLMARATDLLPKDYAASSRKHVISSLKKDLERLREKRDLGQYDDIESELSRFVAGLERRIKENDGLSGELYLLKGTANRLLGELQEGDEAAETFNRAVGAFAAGFTGTHEEQEKDYAGDYGVVLARLGRDSEAAKWLVIAVERNSEDPQVYARLGAIEQAVGNLHKAKACFEQAVELSPYDLEVLLSLCGLLEEEGHLEEASRYYLDALIAASQAGLIELGLMISERLVEIDPENEVGLALRGDLLLQLGDVEQSVALLNNARKIAPENPLVLYTGSRAHQAIGELGAALECANKGLELEPDNPQLWLQKASVLVSLERLADAEGSIKKSLDVDQDFLMGWLAQAELFAQTERYGEALASLDKATQLAPDDSGLILFRARILNAMGLSEKAFVTAQELADYPGLGPFELLNVAAFFVELGEHHDALKATNRALEIDPESVEALELRGSIFVELGQPQEALAAYDHALKIDEANLEAITGKLSTLYALQRWREALTLADDLLRSAPDENELVLEDNDKFLKALAIKGSILVELGQPQEALEAYDRVLSIVPNNLDAVEGKVSVLSSLERWDEAVEVVDRVLQEDPEQPELLRVKAQALFDRAWYKEAADALQAAIKMRPDAGYYYSLGIVRNMQNRFDDALGCFESAIGQDPDDPTNWTQKASALRMLGRDEEAVVAADKALQLSPGDSVTLIEKSIALANLEREKEAIDAMDKAVEANPDEAEVRCFRGLMYQLLHRQEDAALSYQEALQRDPSYTWALSSLSEILQTKGKVTKAMELIEKAVEFESDNIQLLGRKASIYSDMGEFEAAVQTLSGVEVESPTDEWVLSTKGWALENLGANRAAEAKQAYEDALALNPEFPDDLWVRKGLANALRLLSDGEQSRKQYEEVLNELDRRSDIVDAETLALRGWCLYQIGEFEQAVDSYMEALSLHKEMPDTELDFALAIICMGKYKVGVREYERALAAVQKYEPARQRGLLSVALDDLAEAIEEMPKLSDVQEVEDVRKLLQAAFSQAKASI